MTKMHKKLTCRKRLDNDGYCAGGVLNLDCNTQLLFCMLSMLISDSRLIWFGSVYLVTTAGFVADQLM